MPAAESLSARELLARWDRQQTGYIRRRAERFDTILRVLEHRVGPSPRVLDLAAGPGSLTLAVRGRLPGSRVVALDKDPLLLALAREVFAEDAAVEVVAGDLDHPGWLAGSAGPFDAVVSSTALHWLRPHVLVRTYVELTDLLRPGGVFLNGDHLLYDRAAQPGLRRLAAEDDRRTQAEWFGDRADTWDAWWDLAAGQPRYRGAAAERERVWADRGDPAPKVSLGFHLETLRSAGFEEVGTVWQYLDDYVVAAIR